VAMGKAMSGFLLLFALHEPLNAGLRAIPGIRECASKGA
jgi:hypothetical protein